MKKILISLLAAAIPFWMIACAAPEPELEHLESSYLESSGQEEPESQAPQEEELLDELESASEIEPEQGGASASSGSAVDRAGEQREDAAPGGTVPSSAPSSRPPAAPSSSRPAASSPPQPLPSSSSPAPASSQTPPPSVPSSSPPSSTTPPSNSGNQIARIAALVNQEREKKGLPSLTLNAELSGNAQVRSAEIVKKFDHTRPNGEDFTTAITVPKRTWGENIAWGQPTPEAVMDAWMNSPGHRANILREGFTQIGVGVTENAGKLYWVQLFIG